MRPVFPQPGFTEQDIHDLLATRRFSFADCYTVKALDGMTLRYTSVQKKVEVWPIDNPDAVVPVEYSSNEVKISGISLTIGIGVEVDEQTLQLDYSDQQSYMGAPFSSAVIQGRFDGATIRRDRYFMAKPGSPIIGGTPLFVGRLSTAESVGRSTATIKVKSDLVLLNINMPRKLFQPSCTRTLYDPDCGINREDWKVIGTVGSGSDAGIIVSSVLDDNFKYGVIHIEDAEGVTQIRTIKSVGSGGIAILASPLNFIPVFGTNLVAYPGCIRTYERCGDFDNRENFQAFEFVPNPEAAF